MAYRPEPLLEITLYPALQKELETFERRAPKSAEAHKKNLKRLPLGVASNYRAYDPYPIFVSEASGSKFRDLDGNEYLDHNLCFGTLMAGHSHPAVIKAVEGRLRKGTAYGMPHNMEWELAEEICTRFPIEMCRFGNSGTEATMHTIRLARAATGRDKIIKFEGGYHGLHDAALVSVKPHPPADDFGDIKNPKPVSGGAGVPKASIANVLVATFNDLETGERRFQENPNEVAAIILEPIMMNVGLCMPQKGFLEGLRTLCDKHGALLIFDEVKTGAKLCWGGASEYFGVTPDMICLAKSIGGGFTLAGFGAHKRVMGLISDHKVFHARTHHTTPISMAAGIATFREVHTRANYTKIDKLSNKLVDGYEKTVAKVGLQGYIASAGANGALMLYPKEIRNYRDWLPIDVDLWRQYWFGMVNSGVIVQSYWRDEQWTISVQHTEADIDQHLAAFADVAPSLAAAQHERLGALATH